MPTISARSLVSHCTLFVLAACGAFQAHAQQLSVIRPGSFEIGPFLGASYGIDETRFMGGGNVTFAIDKYILPYVEYSYFPGIGRNVTGTFSGTGAPFTEHYALPLSDFHGGVHIRIPIHESPVVPYAVIGAGGLTHVEHTVSATYITSGVTQGVTLQVPGGTDFAFNFGGGMRYYLSPRYGFRVEAKAYKPTGQFNQVFGKAEFGFFIQLR
jgi:hypothetical protein